MDKLSPEVRRERERVLAILDAHKDNLGNNYHRIWNMVRNGTDLTKEMSLPKEERSFGFHWPDDSPPS